MLTGKKKFTYEAKLVRRHSDGTPVIGPNGQIQMAEVATNSPAKIAAFFHAGGDFNNLKRK